MKNCLILHLYDDASVQNIQGLKDDNFHVNI
jgi:hypothetical protein